jgi:hypothetical protein
MPDVLGRSNIRITEGLVHMFNGLGEILAATVQRKYDFHNKLLDFFSNCQQTEKKIM